MAHDPVRLDHARLDWEHEKEYQEGILQSEDAPNELKESAAKRINEAKHYLSLIHFEMNHLDPAVDQRILSGTGHCRCVVIDQPSVLRDLVRILVGADP